MSKILFAYHGGGVPETPEAGEQVTAAWGAWFEALGDAVLDGGNPTGDSRTVGTDGAVAAGGGANPVTGYSLIQAVDIDAAATMAKGCPTLDAGGSVEVAETIDM